MFKVVADQLKVSQGWVRCGQCAEVFDATAHLLPRELPGSPPAAAPDAREAEPLPLRAAERAPDDEPVHRVGQDHMASPVRPVASPLPETPLPMPMAPSMDSVKYGIKDNIQDNIQDIDSSDDPDADLWRQARDPARQPTRRDTFPADEDFAVKPSDAWDSTPGRFQASGSGGGDSSLFGESSLPADAVPADSVLPEDVSFVRDARRKAFWQKPLVKVALGGVSLVLMALLALQVLIQNRDTLAVTHPQLLPVIQALCGPLQCQIRSPRQIESLVIDSSTFNRIGADTYRLSFTLKNTGATVLEMPSLELTLTDNQDQAILRRVLEPAEFGVTAAVLAARAEVAGVVALKVARDGVAPAAAPASSDPALSLGTLRVAGYRILAFYP